MNKKLTYTILGSFLLASFTTVALAGGDAAAGATKSKTCVSCHGANGEGVAKNTKIAGMDVGKFKKAMADYKNGTRKHAMMQMFAKKLSDADVADLAAYYAGK